MLFAPLIPPFSSGASITTVYGPLTLSTADNGWRGLTFIERIAAANLGAATGTQARLTLIFGSLAATVTATCYFGQAAAAGDAYDFSGTQAHVLFSGGDIPSDGVTTTFVSDWITLGEAYDNSKNYVFAAQFVGASGAADLLRAAHTGDGNYFKSGADASTTDKTGYNVNFTDSAEVVTTIEIK